MDATVSGCSVGQNGGCKPFDVQPHIPKQSPRIQETDAIMYGPANQVAATVHLL